MMPTGFKTIIDFRNTIESQIYVTHNVVDGPIDDLSAPAAVKSAPAPTAPKYVVEAEPVTKGIWLLHGNTGHNSILIEFADHLTMFEVPLNESWTKALIDKARATVPGKPVTQAIVSHHHTFDHSGGVRTGHLAEGISIIAHRGTERSFPGSSRPQIHTGARRTFPQSQAAKIHSRGRPPNPSGRHWCK